MPRQPRQRRQSSRIGTRSQRRIRHSNRNSVDLNGNMLAGVWNNELRDVEDPYWRNRRQHSRSRRSRSRRRTRSRSRRNRQLDERSDSEIASRTLRSQEVLDNGSNQQVANNLETSSTTQSKNDQKSDENTKILHENPKFNDDKSDSSNGPQAQDEEPRKTTSTVDPAKNSSPTTAISKKLEKSKSDKVSNESSGDNIKSASGDAVAPVSKVATSIKSQTTLKEKARENDELNEELPQTSRSRKSKRTEPKYEEFLPPHTSTKFDEF